MNLPGSEAAIGGFLFNPGVPAMRAGFFELKASEPGMRARSSALL
jgi:hypothetical protein